jgi:hypothetical protein
LIHSFNQFHPAGHGTFFSGLLQSKNSGPTKPFLWVYDCGSKRRSRLSSMVNELSQQAGKDTINLLCVSHFDADHVNGMTELLKKFQKVDVLTLPYVSLDRRLEIAFDLTDMDAASVDAISFALDPIGYLEGRELLEKVGRVVLIKGTGGPAPEPSVPSDGANPSEREGELSLDLEAGSSEALDDYPSPVNAGNNTSKQLEVVSDSVVGKIINADWEFVFFNKHLPNSITSKTKKPISLVKVEINDVVSSDSLRDDPNKFFKKLRSIYENHFGGSSQERNEISLCVLSRSVRSSKPFGCRWFFNSHADPPNVVYSFIPVSVDDGNSALLLTGDISIDRNCAMQMRSHFGEQRWRDLYVMQIPHHGSKNSWQAGVAKNFPHVFSVLCVPNFDAAGHHPHVDVMADISSKNPIRADYSISIIFAFHKG